MDLKHIDLFMNFYGAENLAAYQLEAAGVHLYNPCEHIYAFHWHCLGGKMHDNNIAMRADRPRWYTKMLGQPPHNPPDAVDLIFPCWSCPAIKMPAGTAPADKICSRSGTTSGSRRSARACAAPRCRRAAASRWSGR